MKIEEIIEFIQKRNENPEEFIKYFAMVGKAMRLNNPKFFLELSAVLAEFVGRERCREIWIKHSKTQTIFTDTLTSV